MTIFPKDPASEVDFSIDWGAWLSGAEIITSANWTLFPDGPTSPVLGAAISSGSVQGIYVSGGEAGSRFRLTCHVTTDAGRSADRSLVLRIMEQ